MLCILKNLDEITSARKQLANRGLNVLPTRLENLLRSLRFIKEVAVGDVIKGWDVLKTVDFIGSNLENDASVLDIGAFSSEILPLLVRMGFSDLVGIDLNPRLSDMPSAGIIRYDVGNFLKTSYSGCSFKAISAISVIEHGYEGDRLFQEVARLLVPGGYFIASFDYWPEKTDNGEIQPFSLSWTIFSQEEVMEMIAKAAEFGLEPVGPLDFCAQDKTISWENREYTFAWIVLQKSFV